MGRKDPAEIPGSVLLNDKVRQSVAQAIGCVARRGNDIVVRRGRGGLTAAVAAGAGFDPPDGSAAVSIVPAACVSASTGVCPESWSKVFGPPPARLLFLYASKLRAAPSPVVAVHLHESWSPGFSKESRTCSPSLS